MSMLITLFVVLLKSGMALHSYNIVKESRTQQPKVNQIDGACLYIENARPELRTCKSLDENLELTYYFSIFDMNIIW